MKTTLPPPPLVVAALLDDLCGDLASVAGNHGEPILDAIRAAHRETAGARPEPFPRPPDNGTEVQTASGFGSLSSRVTQCLTEKAGARREQSGRRARYAQLDGLRLRNRGARARRPDPMDSSCRSCCGKDDV